MRLTRYGLREWLGLTVIAATFAAIFLALTWWWAVGIVLITWLAVVSFFRDPTRRLSTDLGEGEMLSPADGTVSAVEHVDHHEATDGPAVIVRIFLSIFNVHINRIPYDGQVVDVRHRPGKHLDARTAESAKVNESNLVIIRIAGGETIGVRQVSGAVARRIVCQLNPGDQVRRGDRFGMIKFGSTTELILPRPNDVEVLIKPRDKAKGALTVLARLQRHRPIDDGK